MTTPRRRTCSRYAYSRYATRCSPTAVFPVPGAPCTQTVCAASARTMSSWSGWMVATMSRMGPDRGRSISSIRIRLGRVAEDGAERSGPGAPVPASASAKSSSS